MTGCVRITINSGVFALLKLSEKEVSILRFVRQSRHKTTVDEIARGVGSSRDDVQVFVQALVHLKLLNVASSGSVGTDSYYTNPEKREEIFELVG